MRNLLIQQRKRFRKHYKQLESKVKKFFPNQVYMTLYIRFYRDFLSINQNIITALTLRKKKNLLLYLLCKMSILNMDSRPEKKMIFHAVMPLTGNGAFIA